MAETPHTDAARIASAFHAQAWMQPFRGAASLNVLLASPFSSFAAHAPIGGGHAATGP